MERSSDIRVRDPEWYRNQLADRARKDAEAALHRSIGPDIGRGRYSDVPPPERTAPPRFQDFRESSPTWLRRRAEERARDAAIQRDPTDTDIDTPRPMPRLEECIRPNQKKSKSIYGTSHYTKLVLLTFLL